MASLPPSKRITKEDLKGSPDWVTQLLTPINSFFESVYSALDKNLTLGDNLSGNIVSIKVNTKTTYGTIPLADNWEIISTTNPLKIRPRSVVLGQIVETEKFSTLTSPIQIHWDYLNNSIRVRYISGLAASTKYDINLLVF